MALPSFHFGYITSTCWFAEEFTKLKIHTCGPYSWSWVVSYSTGFKDSFSCMLSSYAQCLFSWIIFNMGPLKASCYSVTIWSVAEQGRYPGPWVRWYDLSIRNAQKALAVIPRVASKVDTYPGNESYMAKPVIFSGEFPLSSRHRVVSSVAYNYLFFISRMYRFS